MKASTLSPLIFQSLAVGCPGLGEEGAVTFQPRQSLLVEDNSPEKQGISEPLAATLTATWGECTGPGNNLGVATTVSTLAGEGGIKCQQKVKS